MTTGTSGNIFEKRLKRRLFGRGQLGTVLILPNFIHFQLNVLREHVLGRALSIEPDVWNHGAFRTHAAQAEPESLSRMANRVLRLRMLHTRNAPCNRHIFHNCRCRTRPNRFPA